MPDECTYFIDRFLEAHQCCRGSGGPSSAQLILQGTESLLGWGPAQFVLRSNRSELDARQLACWWWCSLFSLCATCQSACSMSWKGNSCFKDQMQFKQRENYNSGCTSPWYSHLNNGSGCIFQLLHCCLLYKYCLTDTMSYSICRVFGTFKKTNDREMVYAWFTFSHWLIYANSAANPIIYNFLSGKFVTCLISCMSSLLSSSGQLANDNVLCIIIEWSYSLTAITLVCYLGQMLLA